MDRFVRIGIPVSSFGMGQFTSFFHARHRIRDYISEHKPDIIHSNGFRADLFCARISSGVHSVTTVRNHLFENYAYDFGLLGRYLMAPVHLRMLRRIEKAITVSQALSERLWQEYGFACDVVPNAVDQEKFFPVAAAQKREVRDRLGLPPEHRLFVASGHLSSLKDPVCVAEGFLKAAIPNSTMVFIGDGVMREKLEPLVKTGKILLVGRVTNPEAYLQGCDFLVSGSHTEGMPNAVLEAMACGLPCILSDIGSHGEIARYSPASTSLFRVRESESLAEKMREMVGRDYAEISLASVQAVTGNFSAEKMSQNYLRVYTSILNENETLTGEQRFSG